MGKKLKLIQLDGSLTNSTMIKGNSFETRVTTSQFNNLQRKGNEINEELKFEVNSHEIKCLIHGERDIKKCSISFKENTISKKLIKRAIEYCFNNLQMETVFLRLENNSGSIKKQLYEMGFEEIGLVEGKITFLLEKEEKNLGSVLDGYNKKH